MPAALKDLRKAPWTLWAGAIFAFVTTVAHEIIFGVQHAWVPAVSLVGNVVAAFFLLRGARWMWWLAVVALLIGIPLDVFEPNPVWVISVTIVMLASLLAPQSRRYVFPPKPKQPPRELSGTWDPNQDEDSERLSGWYFDPADAARMRYWDAEAGAWLGVTKTPRNLRRAREAEAS